MICSQNMKLEAQKLLTGIYSWKLQQIMQNIRVEGPIQQLSFSQGHILKVCKAG